MDAETLARKMNDEAQFAILWDEGDPWPRPAGLLPYARALVEAEKALAMFESASISMKGFAGETSIGWHSDEMPAFERVASAQAALAALRSLLKEDE